MRRYKQTPEERREKSRYIRNKAAKLAFNRMWQAIEHKTNNDDELDGKIMSFTKGLPHDYMTGLLLNNADYKKFKDGICTGNPSIIQQTMLGLPNQEWKSDKANNNDIKIRAWESAGAGLTYDLQGPDAQSVTMKEAPALGSEELVAEMAEVYCQAVLRDVSFIDYGNDIKVKECLDILNKLDHFKTRSEESKELTFDTVFRGFTNGDLSGHYISQFLLTGNKGRFTKGKTAEFKAEDGKINYGSMTIDQRVRFAKKGKNYLTDWKEFFDAQNGADFGQMEEYNERTKRRFITSGRDLATYVHYDALYQAYLNACLILLDLDSEDIHLFDAGVPFGYPDDEDKQKGFALYGGPHILTLVTEVATRALKAVRYQKFNQHRRLRPEALAARMHKKTEILNKYPNVKAKGDLEGMFDDLENIGVFGLLEEGNQLLPMAYCEGSPMHPSYGAGHATVAGACITVLKAFFNHNLYLNVSNDGSTIELSKEKPDETKAFIASSDGKKLKVKEVPAMTLENELNKLAANISIGRNWAGVHYYSDYKESLLMGEEIAIGILKEQALTYNPEERFYLTVPKFDKTIEIISANNMDVFS